MPQRHPSSAVFFRAPLTMMQWARNCLRHACLEARKPWALPFVRRVAHLSFISFIAGALITCSAVADEFGDPQAFQHFVWSKAFHIPSELTSEESGYFSLIEGKNGRLYVGTAKYGDNAYLVEFDPNSEEMRVVVDCEAEIGVDRKGFAAQSKIHTRNNVGTSGRIYFGTKQGYAQMGESKMDYLGGYPMVYDPRSGKTRVYGIPVEHQGIISITPDESRDIAYISTCSDERPVESTHFMILNLKDGTYQDLMDCRHMYAFIVTDHLGRAYHPILGGDIARYDPRTETLTRLKQTIDGQPPTAESHLADPDSHPINWEVSPDQKTLYAIAMSGNQLYAYDLTGSDETLQGRSLGKLSPQATETDCRAMCVAPDGTVWAGIAATIPDLGQFLHLVSYHPGDSAPTDHGPIAIGNPDYASIQDDEGNTKPWHHGVQWIDDQTLVPRYVVMSICATGHGDVYLTTLYPFTLHRLRIPRVAGITTEYRHNSHADVILTRLFKTDTLDDLGAHASLDLHSVYTDQVPDSDTSRSFAHDYGFKIAETVSSALTDEEHKLSVDGVLLIAEHGTYPESDTGQIIYPKRRLFEEIVGEFDRTGKTTPVFNDKHLADNWDDAKWMVETARERNIPMMAGSSLPTLWRFPPVDVRRGSKLKEIVAVSYHRLDAYGFHAMEMVQCLAERRAGGETGVRAVQCITGDDVWNAGEQGVYDRSLLVEALSRLRERPLPEGKRLEELEPEPVLFVIDYNDGLRANILTLNHAIIEWAAAWRYADTDETESTLFWTQEARPFYHFTFLELGIEKMMHTGQPTWPVERTLLTSGTLDALLISKRDGGKRLTTPWLNVRYESEWNWRQPPEPPPGRPVHSQ